MNFIKKIIFVLFLVSAVCSFSFPAEAAVVRTGDGISVAENEKIDGDFYAAGNDVHISGTVTGDVYVTGMTVTVDGEVKGDVVILGGTATVHGKVHDDVRVVGGKAVIAGQVAGDIVVAGGTLSLLSSGRVEGDLLFFGGSADVSGPVKGQVYSHAQSLTINAPVGMIDAKIDEQLSLGDAAVVSGDIQYESVSEIFRDPGSSVSGTVSRQGGALKDDAYPLKGLATFWLVVLFAVLLGVVTLRGPLARTFIAHIPRMGVCAFLGFGVILLVPITCFALWFSILGFLVGALLIAFYVPLLIFSFIVMHIFVGAYVYRFVGGGYQVNWFSAVIGVAVTQGVLLIPVVGSLLVIAGLCITVGILVHQAYSMLRQ